MKTPGWSNNGKGKNTKLEAGQKCEYPAYQSVGIAIDSPNINPDVLINIKMLAEEYASDNDITITGYRIVTIETVITETELII